MKITTKLLSSFLILASMVALVGLISLFELNKIAGPLNNEIPANIVEITKHAELDHLAKLIQYYDEVLTMSARNYAFTQDKRWENRYNDHVPKLDAAINEAITTGDEEDEYFFASVDEANLALVDMEMEAINLVNQDLATQAIEILDGAEYENQKNIYL